MSIYFNALRKMASDEPTPEEIEAISVEEPLHGLPVPPPWAPMTGAKSTGGIVSHPVSRNQGVRKDPKTGKWSRYDLLKLRKEEDGKFYSHNQTTQEELDKATGIARILNFLQSPHAFASGGALAGATAGALIAGKGNRLVGGLIGGGLGGGAGLLAHHLAKKDNLV